VDQVNQRKVGTQRSNEWVKGGTKQEQSKWIALMWTLLRQEDMRIEKYGCQ